MNRWLPRPVLALTVLAVLAGFMFPQIHGGEAVFNRLLGLAFAIVGSLRATTSVSVHPATVNVVLVGDAKVTT